MLRKEKAEHRAQWGGSQPSLSESVLVIGRADKVRPVVLTGEECGLAPSGMKSREGSWGRGRKSIRKLSVQKTQEMMRRHHFHNRPHLTMRTKYPEQATHCPSQQPRAPFNITITLLTESWADHGGSENFPENVDLLNLLLPNKGAEKPIQG